MIAQCVGLGCAFPRYTSTGFRQGIDVQGLEAHKTELEKLVRLDPRGGFFRQLDVAKGIEEALGHRKEEIAQWGSDQGCRDLGQIARDKASEKHHPQWMVELYKSIQLPTREDSPVDRTQDKRRSVWSPDPTEGEEKNERVPSNGRSRAFLDSRPESRVPSQGLRRSHAQGPSGRVVKKEEGDQGRRSRAFLDGRPESRVPS